jgi:cytochrome P450 monooxygenase
MMIRQAANDTTLPRGGGPDGSQPIFVEKGDIAHCNRYLLHRDESYWGADAAEFKPERWENARPLWNFVPYGKPSPLRNVSNRTPRELGILC